MKITSNNSITNVTKQVKISCKIKLKNKLKLIGYIMSYNITTYMAPDVKVLNTNLINFKLLREDSWLAGLLCWACARVVHIL